MQRTTSLISSVLGLSCLAAVAGAQAPPPLHTIRFDTDQGTFMCVDVSPDGSTLLFDLLGDLYTMPIGGGEAKPLLSGRAWDACPRYSPDGKRVAFISDRVGLINLWTLELASHRLKQVTNLPLPDMDFTGVTGSPAWLPDSRTLVYRVGIQSRGQLTVVGADNAARPLIPAWQIEEGKPATGAQTPTFSPDGHTAYVAALSQAARGDPEGSEHKTSSWVLYRYELGGAAPVAVNEPVAGRDEFKPLLSRSGRYLAYGRSNGPRDQELRVRDLNSGDDRKLMTLTDAADLVAGDTWIGDEIPAYAFTPDDRFIIIWNGGKLQKVSVADGAASVIPMTVHVEREMAVPIRGHYRIPDGPLNVRALRWPTLSPDGKTLVFSAVGSLWSLQLPNGKPTRLTKSDDFEFMPAFSPNGSELAYISFTHDATGGTQVPGRLMVRRTTSGDTRQVISDTSTFWFPSWSADGGKIAVVRETGDGISAVSHYGWVDVTAAAYHDVAPAPGLGTGNQRYITPHNVVFSSDGTELIYTDGPDDNWHIALKAARLDGSAVRELLSAESDIVGFFPSPDLTRSVALGWDYNAYMAPLPSRGAPPVHLSIKAGAMKQRLFSEGGALYPRWLNKETVLYGWTNKMFTYHIGDTRATRLADIALTVPRRGGEGVWAVKDARLITMSGAHGAGRVIEHGTIVVHDRRIVAVGPADSVNIPAGAPVMDGAGLTIMPGFVDTHSHGLEGVSLPAIPLSTPGWGQYNGSVNSGLAYGVTTDWEATGRTSDDASLARIEMLEVGRVRSGRWFPAVGRFNLLEAHGTPYTSYDEVRRQVFHKKELGAEQCVKNYFDKYRTVTQWIGAAVREAGICVVGHVQNPPQLLSRVTDGYSMDHPAMWTPAYRDVVEFMARAGTIWTAHDNLARDHENPGYVRALVEDLLGRDADSVQARKFERYSPGTMKRWLAEPLVPWAENHDAQVARVAAAIVAAGGKIAASTDATPLLENHLEMWSLHLAGMSPGEVLRSATMIAAEKLGITADVGSLAAGKLADFLVLTANPLDRIENTLSLKYTVFAGMVYDSETLERVRLSRDRR